MSFIAFDLDNTILDYGSSLHQLKLDRAELNKISAYTKADLKLRVIAEFGEDYWTELQGFLYTEYVSYARIDSEFVDLLKYLKVNQWQTSIIRPHVEHARLCTKKTRSGGNR
jgi:FMN phosphatase YigB (HAD superfamily)